MSTVTADGVVIKDAMALNAEITRFFEKAGWSFSHDTKAPDGSPEVCLFTDNVLKFAGYESGKPVDFAQTCGDWDQQTSEIVAKWMSAGIIIQQFVWEQERVYFHVIRPGKVIYKDPRLMFDREISQSKAQVYRTAGS